MASTILRNHAARFKKTILKQLRNISSRKSLKNSNIVPIICAVGGSATLLITVYNWRSLSNVHAVQLRNDNVTTVVKLTSREKKFLRFASVEYNGQIYMTPKDFLESVVEVNPRPRVKRRILNEKEIEQIKLATPPLSQSSPTLFRSLREKGIISYTEYLFLLSILIKPQSGFRIAFEILDTDGNQEVDIDEFLVMEKIFSLNWKEKRGMQIVEPKEMIPIREHFVDDEHGLQRRHVVDTTLIVHFFGYEGNAGLNLENFGNFMMHLQTEVLDLEFNKFSNGLMTISELDFAEILLRYTYLNIDKYDKYLERLEDRIEDMKGITFEEFCVFCKFLNNLEDFSIVMRMYSLANHHISKDEFHRAVKICTGTHLSEHIVDTVFALFDENGDGLLSYMEFIAIMKDRLQRGFKPYTKRDGWKAFKTCVKQEMKIHKLMNYRLK